MRIIYPLVIWLGTLLIPFIIALLFIIIFVEKENMGSSWQMLAWFSLISLGVSFPFFVVFSIVYAICTFKKRSNKFTKRALHINNILNILISVVVIGRSFDMDVIGIMLIGALVLLIPSTLLIIFIKIPQKKELTES